MTNKYQLKGGRSLETLWSVKKKVPVNAIFGKYMWSFRGHFFGEILAFPLPLSLSRTQPHFWEAAKTLVFNPPIPPLLTGDTREAHLEGTRKKGLNEVDSLLPLHLSKEEQKLASWQRKSQKEALEYQRGEADM